MCINTSVLNMRINFFKNKNSQIHNHLSLLLFLLIDDHKSKFTLSYIVELIKLPIKIVIFYINYWTIRFTENYINAIWCITVM